MSEDAFTPIAAVADLQDGVPFGAELPDGTEICLIKAGGEIYAVHNRCTHAEFAMSDSDMIDEYVIECGLHGAQFDVRTGEVLELPATDRLPCYRTKVDGGQVLVQKT